MFDAIFHQHHAALVVVREDNRRVVRANPAAMRLFRWSDAGDEVEERDASFLIDACVSARDTGQTHVISLRVSTGETLVAEAQCSSVSWEGDSYLVAILHEVGATEVERGLGASEQRFRQLFDGAPDAMLLADADTGSIIAANDAAVALTRRSASELVGMHYTDLHPKQALAAS